MPITVCNVDLPHSAMATQGESHADFLMLHSTSTASQSKRLSESPDPVVALRICSRVPLVCLKMFLNHQPLAPHNQRSKFIRQFGPCGPTTNGQVT